MNPPRIGINFFRVQRAQKYTPLFSPRTTYKNIRETDQKLLNDMTFNFDRFTVNELKKQFEKRNWCMKLPEFVCVVREHLTQWQPELKNREVKLVRCLANLFRDIDVNGNGDLEWEEFTNYIIEKATVLKNLKSKSDEVKSYTKSTVQPKQKFEGLIPKSVYIPDLNRLAIFQQSSHIIRFMNPDTGQFSPKTLCLDPKKLIVNISSVSKQKGDTTIKKKDIIVSTDIRLLDMLYLPQAKYKMLVTSTSDGVVRGWKYQPTGFQLAEQPDNQEEFVEHQFGMEVYCMAWDELNEVLYCGLKNGGISMWNFKTDTERPMLPVDAVEDRREAHTMMIMDMITMPKLQFMASGGMDGKLVLWDTINHKIKWVYKEHTRGILTLSFNESLILLFSAGFDHQICIWNPYIPTLIHKIQGHLSPILSIKVIQNTNQVVSLDSQGCVKVSDIRRFHFISSFTLQNPGENQTFSPTSMTVIPKPLKLCFTGRSISIFEYDKSYNPNMIDDIPAVCCKYIEDSLVFMTPSSNKVKVWNALSGDIDRIYPEITQGEISAFGLDWLRMRMIVGDTKGNVAVYNARNGAKMKVLPRHAGEVSHILTGKLFKAQIFVSVGTDNQIHVTKETEDGAQHFKSICIRKQTPITCLCLSNTSQVLSVATSHGLINFYQTQTTKCLGGCQGTQQVTSMCTMQQPMLICSAISGRVSLVTMPPVTQRFQRINIFSHTDQEQPGLPLGILLAVYSKELRRYFVADEKCYICCYGMKDVETEYCIYSHEERMRGSKRRTMLKPSGRPAVPLWSVKTHSELVRALDYVASQRLLISCGYDRRVMVWSAEEGKLVDSFQQNYDKRQPKHVALKKCSTGEIFQPTLSDTITMKCGDGDQFDPFKYFKENQKKFGSNPEWKLYVNFKKHYQDSELRMKEIAEGIQKFKDGKIYNDAEQEKPHLDSLIEKSPFLQQIVGKQLCQGNISNQRVDVLHKTLLSGTRTFRQQESKGHTSFKENVGLNSNCTTERGDASFFACRLGRLGHGTSLNNSTSQMNFKLNRQQKQIFGNFTLAKVKSKQELFKQRREHQKYITALSKRDLISKQVGKHQQKILLSKDQVKATQKLTQAFANLDRQDSKMMTLFKNVAVREKQSNSTSIMSTRLPRL